MLKAKRKGRVKYSLRYFLKMQRDCQRGSLVASVTHASQRLKVALGFSYVDPSRWDTARQRIKGDSLPALQINQELEAIRTATHTYFTTTDEPTLQGLQREVFPNAPNATAETDGTTVIAWFGRFISTYKPKGKRPTANTLASYRVVLNAWQAYERYDKTHYDISAFRAMGAMQDKRARTTVESFDRFLAEIGASGQPLTDNSRAKYLKIINTFLRWTEKETGQPLLRGLNTGSQVVARSSFALTEAEREAIEAVELPQSGRMHHVRNAMVMALYTGLRFSEWTKVNPALWREASQPITIPKTGKTAIVVHRAPVRRVLREYAETGFPKILNNNAKTNELIKEVAKKAGLTRLVASTYAYDGIDHSELVPVCDAISTHTLRRTKVTLDLDSGVPLRDICLETGQSEEMARKHYDRPDTATHVARLGVERIVE